MPELSELRTLEECLWQAESRYDPAWMERLFAPDFFEFGRSGRRYVRAELLFPAAARQEIDAVLHDFAIRPLSSTLAQCTYISELRRASGTGSGTEWSNRSSIWDGRSGEWRLRFHQGTPCAPHNVTDLP